MKTRPILIIGKNGKTGSRVAARLDALGHATRAVSRSTNPAFDWRDRATWHDAVAGARAAYVTYQPDLAVHGADADIRAFVELALDSGVEHVVLLSGRGEDGAERAEAILQASGLDWNVVRTSWFMQNFSESFMVDGILAGELALPAGDTREPFVDADDIADVAVAALTRPELRNRLFEVTGPRALTFAECVAAISNAAGYPIEYTEVPVDSFIEAVKEQGEPEAMQWLLHELFTVVFDGRNSEPMTGVEDALGRPAGDFEEYVRKTVQSGGWKR